MSPDAASLGKSKGRTRYTPGRAHMFQKPSQSARSRARQKSGLEVRLGPILLCWPRPGAQELPPAQMLRTLLFCGPLPHSPGHRGSAEVARLPHSSRLLKDAQVDASCSRNTGHLPEVLVPHRLCCRITSELRTEPLMERTVNAISSPTSGSSLSSASKNLCSELAATAGSSGRKSAHSS